MIKRQKKSVPSAAGTKAHLYDPPGGGGTMATIVGAPSDPGAARAIISQRSIVIYSVAINYQISYLLVADSTWNYSM